MTINTDPTTAADPALDALDRISDVLFDSRGHQVTTTDVVVIRDALADRITPAEARIIASWMDPSAGSPGFQTVGERHALRARLGRIADRNEVTR